MKNYYEILGVDKNASKEDIKKAYRKLAHEHHPDKKKGDDTKFKEINEAYQVLGDETKRKQYDMFGQAGAGQGAGGFSGFPGFGGQGGQYTWDFDLSGLEDIGNLEDVFSAFFEGLGVRQKRRTYEHGADVEVPVAITLEEAQSGKVIELDYGTYLECKTCNGLGHDEKTELKTCEHCNGRGEVQEARNTFFGNFGRVAQCKVCSGQGKIPEKACKDCKGTGRTSGKKKIKVEVRPGVLDGQIIKVKGLGEAGKHKAGYGDLYVRLKVVPHKVFERHGGELHRTIDVNIVDLLLGKKIKTETLAGDTVELEIPKGASIEQTIVVQGAGMTKSDNMIVRLNVVTPKKLSRKAQKLLEDLSEEL